MRSRERITVILGAIALAAAVLAVGGALRWTAALITILIALTLLTQVTSRRGLAGVSPLIVIICVGLGLTLLQLIPLPDGVVQSFDPTGYALRVDGTKLANVTAWPALTLDAPGSLRAVTYFIALLGVAVVALRFSASERGRLVCLGAVAAVCGATAAIVGIHRIFGAETLYGVYEPVQATPPVLGPLLNANHLGCLMALGCVLSVGLLLYAKQSMAARSAWALSALGCLVVAMATLSRGAILALGTGLFVVLSIIVAQRLAKPADRVSRSKRRKFIVNTLPIGTVAVCVLVVIVVTSAGTAAEQLANTSLQEIHEPKSKYAAWRSSTALIEETPWVGVGRGALEPAFTRVHPASGFVTFSHLENEYIQAVVEWGVPGAIALACALGWLAIVAIRRWRDGPLAAAGLGGLAVVAVQSNVDFGVELLGLAVPITVVAATLTFVSLKPLHHGGVARARALRLVHLVALAVAAIVLSLPMTRSVAEDHIILDDKPTMDDIRDSIRRHPLDYYGYVIAAEAMIRDRDPNAINAVNHALVLHPTHPGLHLFAGRILIATKHPEQAAVEYVAALRATPEPHGILLEIEKTFPPDTAADAIPLDYENVELVARTLETDGYPKIALAWITRVVDQHPRSMVAIGLEYSLAKTVGDLQVAEKAVRLKLAVMPSPKARLELAQLLAKRGAHKDVVKELADVSSWHGRIEDQFEAWLLLCDSKRALADLEDTTQCLRRLDGSGLVTPGDRSKIQTRLDEISKIRKTEGMLEHWKAGYKGDEPTTPYGTPPPVRRP